MMIMNDVEPSSPAMMMDDDDGLIIIVDGDQGGRVAEQLR